MRRHTRNPEEILMSSPQILTVDLGERNYDIQVGQTTDRKSVV